MKGLKEFKYSQTQDYPVYKCALCYNPDAGCCVVSGVKDAPKGCLMQKLDTAKWTTIDRVDKIVLRIK